MPLRMIGSVMFCLALLGLAGCGKSENPAAPEPGEWTLSVTVMTYDEFGRRVPSAGLIPLSVSAKDRTLHAVLESGQITHAFPNLPYQQYLVTAQKEGYVTAQNTSSSSQYYRVITTTVWMYPLPNPSMRIDSIRTQVNTVVPQVYLRLFTAQVLPQGGTRYAAIFAGLTPDVSSRYGTYAATMTASQQSGASDIQTEDVYNELRAAGFVPGMKVYVTARVMSGAATTWSDEQSGVTRYANLEENSRAVSSFIMP